MWRRSSTSAAARPSPARLLRRHKSHACLGPWQQHAVVEGMQKTPSEIQFVHHSDLAGWVAEARDGHPDPDEKRLIGGDAARRLLRADFLGCCKLSVVASPCWSASCASLSSHRDTSGRTRRRGEGRRSTVRDRRRTCAMRGSPFIPASFPTAMPDQELPRCCGWNV